MSACPLVAPSSTARPRRCSSCGPRFAAHRVRLPWPKHFSSALVRVHRHQYVTVRVLPRSSLLFLHPHSPLPSACLSGRVGGAASQAPRSRCPHALLRSSCQPRPAERVAMALVSALRCPHPRSGLVRASLWRLTLRFRYFPLLAFRFYHLFAPMVAAVLLRRRLVLSHGPPQSCRSYPVLTCPFRGAGTWLFFSTAATSPLFYMSICLPGCRHMEVQLVLGSTRLPWAITCPLHRNMYGMSCHRTHSPLFC